MIYYILIDGAVIAFIACCGHTAALPADGKTVIIVAFNAVFTTVQFIVHFTTVIIQMIILVA